MSQDDSGDGSKFQNPKLSEKVTVSENLTSKSKVIIGSLEQTDLYVEAQFNPKELEIGQTVTWQKPPEANKSRAKNNKTSGVNLEFQGAEGRTLTLDLLFDGYEEKNPRSVKVSQQVEKLQAMASVRKKGSTKEEEKRPHRCIVVWGTVLPKFMCVIESLSIKYLMFSPDGEPLRAQCTVKVKEADFAKPAGKK